LKNSERFFLDIVSTPIFNLDGTRKELVTIGRDVTDEYVKNKSLTAYFNALNAASDIIFIVDDKGKIFFCNEKFIEYFKCSCHTSKREHTFHEIFSDINAGEIWNHISENRVWVSNYRDMVLNITPMMNGRPKPIFYICTLKGNKEAENGYYFEFNN
jgi:PAS domain-containing protein